MRFIPRGLLEAERLDFSPINQRFVLPFTNDTEINAVLRQFRMSRLIAYVCE